MRALPFLYLATILETTQVIPNNLHLLRPHSGLAGHNVEGIDCLSWRLAVETDNIRSWSTVPEDCESYVGNYMLGKQYREDCQVVADNAYAYAKNLTLGDDGLDIWVFDIDETTLSNLPYYAQPEVAFGAVAYNSTAFNEWEAKGIAPAVPANLDLYKKLVNLGFKIVFLTGRSETYRNITIENLKNVGYTTWEKLILKQTSESSTTALVYKSTKRAELEAEGYRILGNMGDQWSDLFGTNVGNRTFKVPDPMYYIS
ncbi:acid phosphatase 1-like isoform X3 [Quercus robur]|uniref:acid phosphatase 1-like isoform X3 n=1 Tax=Quercus robur TaxID=38942 RepID=UPI0021611B45|nr:acid phosphatase 1-like isoform X3 [Quercus robur]